MASLATVRKGDIVQVNIKGRVGVAFVQGKDKGELEIDPITPGFSYFHATARQVTRHWRQTKNTRRTGRSSE